MSEKIGQRFTAHETLETTKLGTLVRATDDRLAAPALVLRLSAAARADDATLAAVLADNRKLADCPQALVAYCSGRDDQGAWIAIEATDGCLAEESLRRRDKLEMPHLVDAALAMAGACAAASRADVWIGDLGPHRLWLQGGAAGGKIRTFGYGWWRLLPAVAPGSAAEEFFGAPEYLAAEACKGGALSPASDVYCAATTVWSLAAGKPPFHGPQPLSVIKRQAAEKPLRLDLVKPALKGVKDLQAALTEALDKDPAKRPTAAAWQQTLQAAATTWGPLPSGADATVPQRAGALGGAIAAPEPEPAPTVVVKVAVEPAPVAAPAQPQQVAEPVAAPEAAAPAPAPAPAPEPAAAKPDVTAVPTAIKAEAAPVAAPPAPADSAAAADDDDEGEDDDEPASAAGVATDPNRRGKKGKKSRRDRDRGGPQPIAGKSAPTPIASPAPKVERSPADVAKPAEPAKVPAAASAAVSPAPQAKAVTVTAAPAPAASPAAAGTGRTVKTTDRIRVEAMHESAFFSHNDKHEAGKDLHEQGPPVPPPQKVNKLLLGALAAFAVAMLAVGVYIKVNAPPEPPPVPPEGSEAAAPPATAPAPTPAPVPEPAPAPAADIAAPNPEPAVDAVAAAPEVAAEVTEPPSAQAAKLVEEGQALLRAGTLDQALEKAKAAQVLLPGDAQAAALQKQVEQAQVDAAAGAATAAAKTEADNKAAAAKAEADNKAAAEAEAKKKAADEAAAKQAAAELEKAEAERKKADDKAAKQAEADRKKQEEQATKAEAAKKKAEAEVSKADEQRKKKEEAAAKKADEERRKADEERKKAAESEKARKADEARKKKEEAAAKKEAAKPPKVEKAEKPPAPPAAAEANDAQKEAARFAVLAQKATTAKLKVLYLRKAVDRDPANGKFKQMLKDAEAELAAQPN